MNKFTKDYFLDAAMRAFHTFWQSVASMLAVGLAIHEIDWKHVLSVAIIAAIISVAKSFAVGMPEAAVDGEFVITAKDDEPYKLNFEKSPETFSGKKSINLKVVESADGGSFNNQCRNGVTGVK